MTVHTVLLQYVSGTSVTIVTIDVFDLLSCTHNVLRCDTMCLQQFLVNGFFGHYNSMTQ